MTETLYYMISAGTSVLIATLTLAGTIFACIQLYQIKQTRKKQFEQSRRENSVSIVKYYVERVDSHTKAVEKIVTSLSDEQCKDLYDGTPFFIDEKTKTQICTICPCAEECKKTSDDQNKPCQNDEKNWIVKGEILFYLRYVCISYLNTLESVLLAWEMNIVDQDSIVEQFSFLDKKRHKERALEEFRTIAGGGKSYPAIEKFYQILDLKRLKSAEKTQKEILK